MILSIGMIIKNEGKNLRECLSRLRPVLDGIDSELIIADTGSSDGSLEIAGEFTEKILKVKWTDDFSEARNHTVKASSGEWYMYLDADDFFEDSSDIISFFNSGEYKKYGCATFEIWNYNPDGISCAVQHALHLVKMSDETRFENSIHERIVCEGPRKDLKSRVRHIGYENNGDGEKQRLKHERNISLLQKEYEKKPDDPSVLMHLINEYKTAERPEEFKRYLDEAEGLGFSESGHPLFHFFFHSLAYYYMLLDDGSGFVRAINTVGEYLKRRRLESVTSIDMLYFMGCAYLRLHDVKKALDAFQICRGLIEKYAEGKLDMSEATTLYVNNAGESGLTRMIILTAICYAGINDYHNMSLWVKKITPSRQIYADELFCGLLASAGLTAAQELEVFERYVYRAYENIAAEGTSAVIIGNNLTGRHEFIINMKTAFDCVANSDLRGYVSAVKTAIGFDARYDFVVKRQLKLFVVK